MMTEHTPIINDDKKQCNTHIPCAKFIVAGIISLSAFGFGCGMLISGGATAPLAPFYTSLIAGSVAYWTPSPSPYPNKDNN